MNLACREKKDLEISQVRQNIEDSKRLGSEKSIRNKSELDRRVRELKSNNTKKFVEERKRQMMKQDREKETLIKSHETQKTTLLDEIDKVRGGNGEIDVLPALRGPWTRIPYRSSLNSVSLSRCSNTVKIIRTRRPWLDFHHQPCNVRRKRRIRYLLIHLYI